MSPDSYTGPSEVNAMWQIYNLIDDSLSPDLLVPETRPVKSKDMEFETEFNKTLAKITAYLNRKSMHALKRHKRGHGDSFLKMLVCIATVAELTDEGFRTKVYERILAVIETMKRYGPINLREDKNDETK